MPLSRNLLQPPTDLSWQTKLHQQIADLQAKLAIVERGASGTGSYTVAWTSTGTAPAIGNGTLTGKYYRTGPLVWVCIDLVAGSTTTFGTGNYRWSLPVPVVGSPLLPAAINNSGVLWYAGIGVPVTSTTIAVIADNTAGSMTGTAPFTLGTSDRINVTGTYSVA